MGRGPLQWILLRPIDVPWVVCDQELTKKLEQKMRGEGRGTGFFEPLVVNWGGFTAASSIYLENGKSYMTSEGGIFLVFQWGCGKNCEIGQNRPRNGQKSDFLAIFGLWEALKTPYRCDLKLKLVELLMGHNLKAFRAKKIWPGWQGGSETNFGVRAWKRLSRRKIDR